jgi:hypothetical protein
MIQTPIQCIRAPGPFDEPIRVAVKGVEYSAGLIRMCLPKISG